MKSPLCASRGCAAISRQRAGLRRRRLKQCAICRKGYLQNQRSAQDTDLITSVDEPRTCAMRSPAKPMYSASIS